MEMTLTEIEQLADQDPFAQWNGWTLELYKASPNAYMRTQAAFVNNQWCTKTVIQPNNRGNYDISNQYINSLRFRSK